MPERFHLELRDSRMLAPSMRHLAFVRRDGQILNFIPGQFLQIHFQHEGQDTKRSYSLANHPQHEHLEIAVSYVENGAASALLSALAHGEAISASGPYGRFCLLDGDRNARYLLIGTGTGITPYRAMLPSIDAAIRARGTRFVLLFGARNNAELLYREDFQAMAERHPQHFQFLPCLSRASDCDWPDARRGYVQEALASLAPDAAQDIAYLCGNPNMVDACFNALKDHGLPVPAIRREKYVSSR